MKPSNIKCDYKDTEKQEPEEPPKWFQAYAVVVGSLEKQLIVTMEKLEELKDAKNEKSSQKKMINQRKRMNWMLNVQIYYCYFKNICKKHYCFRNRLNNFC